MSSKEKDLESSTIFAPFFCKSFKNAFTLSIDIPDATLPVKVTTVSSSTSKRADTSSSRLSSTGKPEKLIRVSGWSAQCRVRFSRILPGFSSRMVCRPACASSSLNSAQLSLPRTTTAVFWVPPLWRARLKFTPLPPASREITLARFSWKGAKCSA